MKRMSRFPTALLVPLVILACDRGATAPAGQALAQGQLSLSGKASAPVLPNLPASCSGLYTRPLTTGTSGVTYYDTYDCSGQAYGVDGFCRQTPCKTALSTFGCAMDWDSCNGPVGTHSKYTYAYPNTCLPADSDASDYVPVQYDASWTCCDDGQCSGGTPHCNPYQNQCVQCTESSQCSGGTPCCDTGSSTCVQCCTDAQCSGQTPHCDTGSHTCVQCTQSSQCQPGYECSGGYCVCTFDPTCNGRSCSNNSQCTNGTCGGGRCRGGTCQCPTRPVRQGKSE
jgi:hypothetical protein